MKNYYLKGSIDVASIVDKIQENRLDLRHVLRRDETDTVRLVKEMYIEIMRTRMPEKY